MAFHSYYEGIGVLIKNKLISPQLVDDLLSMGIIGYWEKYGSIFLEMRRRYNALQTAEGAEILYNSVMQVVLREHPEIKKNVEPIWRVEKTP